MTAILKQFQATPPPASVKPLRRFVLLAVVLILIISVSPPMATLSRNIRIIFNDMLQQPQHYHSNVVLVLVDPRPFLKPPPIHNIQREGFLNRARGDCFNGTRNWVRYTLRVPPPQVQKAKPPSQRNFVIHQRDPHYPHIPYPSRMNQEKQKEKDEVQIHKFWQMFKQLHINISLADALIKIPKYQKMLKSLLSKKEKLIELANTPPQ
ncbi:hypothetical protein Tco_1508075 [Tanacetum coccineum]